MHGQKLLYGLFAIMMRGIVFFGSQIQYAYALSGLVISEIYADGTEEWIELVNVGPNHFSGTVTISGVKATPITLTLELAPQQTMIIGDTVPGIFDTSCVGTLGLSLQINDNSAFSVELISGSDVLDTFSAPSTPHKRTSIQRFWSGSNLVTRPSDNQTSTNIEFHFDASPCVSALTETIVPLPRQDRVPTTQQGLMISEILWDGSAEYIEIVNRGPNHFVGTIAIQGVDLEPRVYSLSLPAFQTHVIAHTSLLPQFSSGGISGITYQGDTLWQRIRDDQRLTAILYSGSVVNTGQILDLVNIARATMLLYDNQQRSWERIRTDTGWIREIANDARITGRQTSAPHKGNPGFVRSSTGHIIFPHIPEAPILTCDQSIMIEEVHRDDGYVSNYVDIVIMTGFVGSFSLSGQGVFLSWTGVFAPGQHVMATQTNIIHPLIQSSTMLNNPNNSIYQIIRNGIVVDQIIVGGGQGTGKSLYASSSTCGRSFDTLAPATPFMSQSLFSLNPKTEVIITITQPSPSPTPPSGGCPQCQICQNMQTGSMITDNGQCLTGVDILSTLSTSPLFINAIYATGEIHRVSITNGSTSSQSLLGYSLHLGTLALHKRMTGLLYPSHSLIHDLPLSPHGGCYQLLHMGLVRSTLCFDPTIHGHGIVCQGPSNLTHTQGHTGGTIANSGLRLMHVDYAYPSGQPQAVTISLASGLNPVNLSQYRLRVNQNNTRLTITGAILNPGQALTVWRNFNFPRSNPTTIHLLHLTGGGEVLIDSYFYDPSSPSPSTGAITTPSTTGDMIPPDNSIPDPTIPPIPPYNHGPDAWDLTITHIDYAYPAGQPQSITLLLTTGASSLPLSQFRLRVNTNQTRLTITGAQLIQGEPLTVWRNFNFPRTTATTVHLLYLSGSHEIPITSYSYDPKTGTDESPDDNIATGSLFDPRTAIVRFEGVIWNTPSGVNQSVILRMIDGPDRLGLDRFRLRVNDNTTRQTLGSDNLIRGESITITRNFRFPKTRPSTIRLLYLSGNDEILMDTFSYDPTPNDDPKDDTPSLDITSLKFRIKEIVYDPSGPDTGNEVIVIEYLQGPSPLSTKEFRIRINGSNKTLYDDFVLGDNRFQKTFGLPNTKATCVELIHAKTSTVFDTLCYDPSGNNPDKTLDEETIELRIVSLVYDVPPRTDQRITLLYSGANNQLSLAPYSLIINGKRRMLRNFGPLKRGEETELIGNFGFLKTKDTCVSLARGEIIFDTRCYSPTVDKKQKKNTTDLNASIVSILTIDAVIPNPKGKDDREQIHLRLLSGTLPVDLFQYFLMTDKGKRIVIRGMMTGEIVKLVGSFALPNSATCLTLHHKKTPTIPMARLCYPKPAEDILYDGTQAMLLSATEQSPYRVTYHKGIVCLYVNNRKTECFDRVLEDYHRLRLATQYINELQSELIYNFPTLRFYSRLHPMAVLYREHVGFIDQKKFTITRRGVSLPVSSFGDHYDLHYGQRMEGLVMDGVMKLFE